MHKSYVPRTPIDLQFEIVAVFRKKKGKEKKQMWGGRFSPTHRVDNPTSIYAWPAHYNRTYNLLHGYLGRLRDN